MLSLVEDPCYDCDLKLQIGPQLTFFSDKCLVINLWKLIWDVEVYSSKKWIFFFTNMHDFVDVIGYFIFVVVVYFSELWPS